MVAAALLVEPSAAVHLSGTGRRGHPGIAISHPVRQMVRRTRVRLDSYGPRLVESVPAFLDELAARLVPTCDRAVVQGVFARASAGYSGPRGRDGLRVTAITPSGVPFEASVTGGAGRSSAALRYVTETATAMPFFGPRLAAQRAALDDLVGWLPPPARNAAGGLRDAIDVVFPDPAAVPARTRFATTFGIVHRDDVPDGLAGLKLYLNVRAGEPAVTRADDPVSRLVRRWPAVAGVQDLVGDLAFLVPHFATVEVDAAGRLGHKLYLRTRRANGAALAVVARRFGADLGPVADELRRAGVADDVWRRRLFVCCATAPGAGGGTDGPELSVHLSGKALGLDPAGVAQLARGLVEQHGDTDALDALEAAIARSDPGGWATTVIGLGLADGGGVGKVNVYAAPIEPTRRAQPSSNSGWMGSRVTA